MYPSNSINIFSGNARNMRYYNKAANSSLRRKTVLVMTQSRLSVNGCGYFQLLTSHRILSSGIWEWETKMKSVCHFEATVHQRNSMPEVLLFCDCCRSLIVEIKVCYILYGYGRVQTPWSWQHRDTINAPAFRDKYTASVFFICLISGKVEMIAILSSLRVKLA